MKLTLLIIAILIVIAYPIVSSLYGPRQPLTPTSHNELIMAMVAAGIIFPVIAFLLTHFLRKGFKHNKPDNKKP